MLMLLNLLFIKAHLKRNPRIQSGTFKTKFGFDYLSKYESFLPNSFTK